MDSLKEGVEGIKEVFEYDLHKETLYKHMFWTSF